MLRFRPAVLALLFPFLLPAAAHAQLSMGGGPGAGSGKSSDDDKPPPAPPPAIPGAVSSPDRVAPAAKNVGDLDPNAALFDAIDRGDLTAARDALGRGADLHARNVLGQRPIDMSIDLNRNDITFLLLSMRAENGDAAPDTAGAGSGGEAGGDAASATLSSADQAALAAAPAPVRPVASGGVPAPQQGFLGFNK